MHPTVRRTWAPKGQTPILHQRGRSHQKISTIGTLTISPQRRRMGLFLHWHPGRNIAREEVIAFLEDLLRHLRGQRHTALGPAQRTPQRRGQRLAGDLPPTADRMASDLRVGTQSGGVRLELLQGSPDGQPRIVRTRRHPGTRSTGSSKRPAQPTAASVLRSCRRTAH